MKCAKCGFDDNGTGDTAHVCMSKAELNEVKIRAANPTPTIRLLSKFEKESVSAMQQAIFNLQQAKEKIRYVRGNSDVGRSYIENIDSVIENLHEDIANIWEDQDV